MNKLIERAIKSQLESVSRYSKRLITDDSVKENYNARRSNKSLTSSEFQSAAPTF